MKFLGEEVGSNASGHNFSCYWLLPKPPGLVLQEVKVFLEFADFKVALVKKQEGDHFENSTLKIDNHDTKKRRYIYVSFSDFRTKSPSITVEGLLPSGFKELIRSLVLKTLRDFYDEATIQEFFIEEEYPAAAQVARGPFCLQEVDQAIGENLQTILSDALEERANMLAWAPANSEEFNSKLYFLNEKIRCTRNNLHIHKKFKFTELKKQRLKKRFYKKSITIS